MTTYSDMSSQAFNHWLGLALNKESLAEISLLSSPMHNGDIGNIRTLFEQLALLRPTQRQQVVQWGVWVQDTSMLQLLSWSLNGLDRTNYVSHTKVSLNQIHQLDDETLSGHWRRLLFTPYLIKMPNVDVNHSPQPDGAHGLFYAD